MGRSVVALAGGSSTIGSFQTVTVPSALAHAIRLPAEDQTTEVAAPRRACNESHSVPVFAFQILTTPC